VEVPTRLVEPLTAPPDAVVRVPGSKSITNRALVCAALAGGRSTLSNVGFSDDTEAMLDCVARLGADVRVDRDAATAYVVGTAGVLAPGPIELDTRLAGTTSRFVTALVALGRGRYRIDGAGPLRARPMGPLHDALVELGASVEPEGEPGHLPVVIETTGLTGGRLAMPGDVSSQFVTALLLVGPATAQGIEIELTTELVSRPYLDMTAAVMGWFGVDDAVVEERRVAVRPGRYRRTERVVEPDASSAAYLWAAAAITGGRVAVPGLSSASLQGDVGFAGVLARMGAQVEERPDPRGASMTEVRGTGFLHGIDVDLADLSDTVPTLAAVAAFADGPTRISGVGFIRSKESDRIGALVGELRRCGVEADEEPDGLVVRPGADGPHGARVRTFGDHRIAMAFALIGLRVPGIEIEDPDVVGKSFPGFWSALDALVATTG